MLLSIILRLSCVAVGGVARREIRFDMRFERQRQAFQIIRAARDSDGDFRLALGRDDAVGLRFSRALCDSHNEIRLCARRDVKATGNRFTVRAQVAFLCLLLIDASERRIPYGFSSIPAIGCST